jgi:tRNA-uridine 2-sulfurtransferase
MISRERVIVAMSGGVDSAVAAARLVDQGHDVVGVTLHLWDYPEEGAGSHGRCCAPEDQYDARRTADALGIPHFTFDRRELFAKTVVEPFVEAYLAGETPSPCTACNRGVKIAELVALADRLGAAKVATGHYARLARTADGIPYLREGRDGSKDQSYFLYATPREHLERLVFPLGDSLKPEVRAEAVARAIPGATKGESQELCFVGAGAGAYAAFVEDRAKGRVRPASPSDSAGASALRSASRRSSRRSTPRPARSISAKARASSRWPQRSTTWCSRPASRSPSMRRFACGTATPEPRAASKAPAIALRSCGFTRPFAR